VPRESEARSRDSRRSDGVPTKPRDERDRRIAELERETARLRRHLERRGRDRGAKKLSLLLGVELPDPNETP
jgi:hypothetical protein